MTKKPQQVGVSIRKPVSAPGASSEPRTKTVPLPARPTHGGAPSKTDAARSAPATSTSVGDSRAVARNNPRATSDNTFASPAARRGPELQSLGGAFSRQAHPAAHYRSAVVRELLAGRGVSENSALVQYFSA